MVLLAKIFTFLFLNSFFVSIAKVAKRMKTMYLSLIEWVKSQDAWKRVKKKIALLNFCLNQANF